MTSLSFFTERSQEILEERKAKGLFRALPILTENSSCSFASNDYLGLSLHSEVIRAGVEALKEYGSGSGASPLVDLRHPLFDSLAQALSPFLPRLWSALFVSSGFVANQSFFEILRALGLDVELYVDHRAHASLIAGARSSGLKVFYYEHKSHDSLSQKIARSSSEFQVIVTESLHSMDGDFEDSEALDALAQRFSSVFFYIDEAHSTGLFPSVFWSFAKFQSPLVLSRILGVMAGCGKAVGASGGLLLLPQELVHLGHHVASPFVYSTAPSPAVVASVVRSFGILGSQEGEELRSRLQDTCGLLKVAFDGVCSRSGQGVMPKVVFDTGRGGELSPIVGIYAGSIEQNQQLAAKLLKAGFRVPVIRPPTVPRGTQRIRLCVSLNCKLDQGAVGRFLQQILESKG